MGCGFSSPTIAVTKKEHVKVIVEEPLRGNGGAAHANVGLSGSPRDSKRRHALHADLSPSARRGGGGAGATFERFPSPGSPQHRGANLSSRRRHAKSTIGGEGASSRRRAGGGLVTRSSSKLFKLEVANAPEKVGKTHTCSKHVFMYSLYSF